VVTQHPLRVIVTGASSGIGAALARRYAAAGATLGLVARRRPELEQLAAGLIVPCEIYALDVRDAAALTVAAGDFTHKHGCPDVVIANAGVSLGTLTELAEDIAAFQEVLDINVMGMVKVFQPFVEPMRRRRLSRAAGRGSLFGFQGSRHLLSRELARRVADQRRQGNNLVPRLHRHADDAE
jgi:NADP-dependent 3-hydroxy acid dehydrogenase YdfG